MYRRYAQKTSVSVDKSLSEIKRTLDRYGANSFMYGTKDILAVIRFEMNGKRVRFDLPLPSPEQFRKNRHGRRIIEERAMKNHEQACRQSFRALALAVKAKLEAVEAKITSFEEEFMAHIELPNGSTVGKWMVPQIEAAYSSKKMPPLLEGAKN